MYQSTDDSVYAASTVRGNQLMKFVKQLEKEHFILAQELNEFYMALQLGKDADEHKTQQWQKMIPALRGRVLDFLLKLGHHFDTEEQVLLPAMEMYCKEEHTFPSVRFSSILMEQHFQSARAYFQIFFDHTDILNEPLSKNEVKKIASHLREGLIMLAEYFKVEQQFILKQAEQMLSDI